MKKRLLAIILSMTLFVLSVVGVGAVDATQGEDTISVVTMDPETGIESRKVYDVSGNDFELLSETILSTTEPMNLEGTPVSQLSEQENNNIVPRAILGANNSTVVSNTEIHPYSAIAYLEVIFPDLEILPTTAYLISENVAVTSAHSLYSEEHGGWPISVAVFPGKTGVGFWNDPYQSCYAINWTVSEDWLEIEQDDSYADSDDKNIDQMFYDWAIFELTFPLGNNCESIDTVVLDTNSIANLPIKISGYPQDLNGDRIQDCIPYETNGTISEYDNGIILINEADTYQGHSGSPVLYYDNIKGEYVSCGIFTGSVKKNNIEYNKATFITTNLNSYFAGFVAAAN